MGEAVAIQPKPPTPRSHLTGIPISAIVVSILTAMNAGAIPVNVLATIADVNPPPLSWGDMCHRPPTGTTVT
jgi:hypothetical protein